MKQELAKIKDLVGKLNYVLSKQQKYYAVIMLFSMVLASVLEMWGVAAIMPMVEGLMDIKALLNKWYIQPLAKIFHFENDSTWFYIICLGIVIIYVLKNVFSYFNAWLVKKYAYKVNRELGTRVMESYIKQGYIFFVNNNSARLLQGISGDVSAVNNIISSIFSLLIKLLMVFAISVFIFFQEPVIAIILLVLSGTCVSFIQMGFKKPMIKYGNLQRVANWNYTQACLEIIQGNKEVLVTGREEYFKKRYVDSVVEHNRCAIKIELAAVAPAFIIETASITALLFAIALQVSNKGFSADTLVNLSVVAVGAFRILPAVGAISSAFNTIRSQIPAFNASYQTIKTVNELEEKARLEEKEYVEIINLEQKVRFNRELSIENIYYKYPETTKYILEDVSLKITAHSSIGIFGTSGGGKSTFVDVMLGLLQVESGHIKMDGTDIRFLGKQWNYNIGYVPQSIYLVDENIRANVAFGIPKQEIDDEKVWRALEMAQLSDFVKKQPDKLDTTVGEWGIKFSGGQRQRIAIARALYSNPEILVMDEATAALDGETENALMEAINALLGKKTLIIVAHRLTTIKRCDKLYEVKDGKMIERSKKEVFGET